MTKSNWIFLGLGVVFIALMIRKSRNDERKEIDGSSCGCSDSVRRGMVGLAPADAEPS